MRTAFNKITTTMVSLLKDSEKEAFDFFESIFKELLRTESIPKKQVNVSVIALT